MATAQAFDVDPASCLAVSAKTGLGMEELLAAIVDRIPPPKVNCISVRLSAGLSAGRPPAAANKPLTRPALQLRRRAAPTEDSHALRPELFAFCLNGGAPLVSVPFKRVALNPKP
jgi:hypothetical protein